MRINRFVLQLVSRFLTGILLGIGLSGCGIFSWFDSETQPIPRYSKSSEGCRGLDLRAGHLDGETFVRLVECVNSNGELDSTVQLLHEIPQEALDKWVAILDKEILQKPNQLYLLKHSFEILEKNERLRNEWTRKVAKLHSNDESLRSFLQLMRDLLLNQGKFDSEASQHFQAMSGAWSSKSFGEALKIGAGLSVSGFGNLVNRSSSGRPIGKAFLKYMADVTATKELLPVHTTLNILTLPEFGAFKERFLGKTPEEIRTSISEYSEVYKMLLMNDARILKEGITFFHHARKPVKCVRGIEEVKNGALFGLEEVARKLEQRTTVREMAEFIQREHRLQMVALSPFCDFTQIPKSTMAVIDEVAQSSAILPISKAISAFLSLESGDDRPVMEFFVNFYGGSGPNNDGGIRHLLPIGTMIHDQQTWGDWIAWAEAQSNLGWQQASPLIRKGLPLIKHLESKLGDRGIEAWKRLFDLFDIGSDEPSAWLLAQETFESSNRHPIADLLVRGLQEFELVELFAEEVLKDSRNELLVRSLAEIGVLAENERMIEIARSLLNLFEGAAKEGFDPEVRETKPRLASLNSESHWRLNVPEPSEIVVTFIDLPELSSCRKLDHFFSIDQESSPEFDREFEVLLTCLGENNEYADLVVGLRHLNRPALGGSLFRYQLNLFKQVFAKLSDSAIRELLINWRGSMDDGSFETAIEALGYWAKRYQVLDPVIRLTQAFTSDSTASGHLFSYASKLLASDDFEGLVGALRRNAALEPNLVVPEFEDDFNRQRISRWVHNKECVQDRRKNERRVDQIIDDFLFAKNNWDLQNGVALRSWDWRVFRKKVTPLFNKAADPKQNNTSKSVIDGLVNVVRYFSLQPGERRAKGKHYRPEYLGRWLKERSSDYVLMPYFYRGEKKPRVRLVNTLDRLALIVLNADQDFLGTNLALKYTTKIAKAWGDLPRSMWPREIQQEFRPGTRPKTLREVYRELEKVQVRYESQLAGYPKRPKCRQKRPPAGEVDFDPADGRTGGFFSFLVPRGIKARIYNIRQALNVMKENLPGSRHPNAGGMNVVRDLFWEMYSTSPKRYRRNTVGEKNNLYAVVFLTRIGFLRQLSKQVARLPEDDKTLDAFSRVVVDAVKRPKFRDLFRALFRDDRQHKVLWSVFEKVFTRSGRTDAEVQQMKQTGYMLLVALDRARGTLGRDYPKLIDRAMASLVEVVRREGSSLTGRKGPIEYFISSEELWRFVMSLDEMNDSDLKQVFASVSDFWADPKRFGSLIRLSAKIERDAPYAKWWAAFKHRKRQLHADRGYPEAEVSDLVERLFDDVESGSEASRQLRKALASSMTGQLSFEGWVRKLGGGRSCDINGCTPDQFSEVITALGKWAESGELMEFAELIKRQVRIP